MPTYEYECQECDHRFEKFQSITEEAVKTCEKCGSEVKKVFGSTGIIFKGSGFYVNDYKKNKGESNCNSCSSASSCPSASE